MTTLLPTKFGLIAHVVTPSSTTLFCSHQTYTGARNALETPIAMRTQFIYWKIAQAVLSATKKHGIKGLEMLEPFPKENTGGNQVYSPPDYKLPDKQLDYLYANVDKLKLFRAEAAACALYNWWDVGLTQYMQNEPRLLDMKEYLFELNLDPKDRTHFGFDPWKNEWPDLKVDVAAPCVPERRLKKEENVSPIVWLSPQVSRCSQQQYTIICYVSTTTAYNNKYQNMTFSQNTALAYPPSINVCSSSASVRESARHS